MPACFELFYLFTGREHCMTCDRCETVGHQCKRYDLTCLKSLSMSVKTSRNGFDYEFANFYILSDTEVLYYHSYLLE